MSILNPIFIKFVIIFIQLEVASYVNTVATVHLRESTEVQDFLLYYFVFVPV
jgi:hypothetical protein